MRRQLGALTLLVAGAAWAQDQGTFEDPTARVFQLMLPPGHLLGYWGGLRSRLEESGIVPRLMLVTDGEDCLVRDQEIK